MKNNNKKELNITRIFDAPRELVFKAWTDENQMSEWWGPKGFTNPVCELDVRPGGAIRIDMQGPDGVVYPMKGVFEEVKKPEKLVFNAVAIEDNEGNSLMEVLTTVIFEEINGKTKMILNAVVTKESPEAEQAISGMDEGWKQSLDRLEEFIIKK